MHRISHNFDDETPTPLSMSKNSSFDSAFVTMTKFVEYSSGGSGGGTSSTLKEFHSTNQQWAQYSKILHPSIVQKMNQSKSASDYVKELYALMGWNVNNKSGTFHAETIKKNVKTILKTMEEISLLFSVGSFQDVSVLMTTATTTTTTTTTTSSMNLSNSSSSSGSNNTNDSSTMSATMTQFFHILLSLLSTVDDKKLVELIHVFVCEMNLSELERNQLLSTLKKQFSMFNIINRMHCVKTVDRLISSHLNNNNNNNNSNNTKNNKSSNKNSKTTNMNSNTSSSGSGSGSSHQTTMIETLYTFIKQVFEEYGKPDSFAEKKGLSSLLNVGFSKEKINKLNLLKTSVKMIQRPYMIQYLISNHHILSSTTTATTTATPATKSSKSSQQQQQQTSSFIIDSLLNVSRNKDLVCARESIAALSCIACELSSNIQTSHLSNIVLDAMSRWIPKYSISVHPPGVHIAVSASSSSSAIPSVGGASVMGGSSSSGGGGVGGIGGASASASGVVSFAYSHTEPAKKSDLKKATLLPYLNTDDVYSRYHLCQMSALVVKTLNLPSLSSSSSSSKKQYDDNSSSAQVSNDDEKYSDLLKYLIHDENLVVFFEAIKHISLRNFSFFIQKDMNQQSAQTILDFVVKRLCNSLAKHKSQTQIHAACKASEHLLMSYAKFVTYCSIDPYSSHPPESPEMKQCAASLLRLYDSIDELTTFDCCFVRLQAFKAILWRQESLESTLKLLKMEVKSNMTWTPFHIHELMLTLLKFSRVQFAVFEHFADFACFLCIYLSERLDLDLLIALLRAVVPSRDAPKRNQIASKFLRMMFHILDNCLTGSKESVQLSLTLYAFLGDIANKVTGEPRDERDNVAPQSQQQKQMMDPKQIFQRPEMFDIQNGAMKAIIIRLTHNCMYNNPQVRTVCTEALAKIAFRSQGSVRLFIYEVFQYLAQIPALGLGAQALGMIQVLNEVYQLQQQLVKLLYKQPSDVETLDFFEAHEQLKKKIAFFTRIPPSYMIVGRASQALLAKGHHLKFNSRK